ncbi:MAG: trehalose 6-phosphate phosphatase [Frankiaceae bacterium]|nr:trehalose 6-phosphate phosphatase [Frankiaceae bacterium]MDQ1699075.1 trehalose 6-phosphate phosphatase [Frankiaceae bacterium]
MLPDPRTAAGRLGLAAVLADPARAAIAIDYDGTLAPIVSRPEDARPAAGAIEALTALALAVGRCAVVSGRGAQDAVALGGLDAVPGLLVVGHYGLESWFGGQLDSPPPEPGVDAARQRVAELVRAAPEGVHLEDKRHSLVVHTRPAADPAAALTALTEPLQLIARACGLEVVPGRMVLELRPPGIDKGLAVGRLAEGWGAVGYIGDDLGDLPAYDAVEQLRADGVPGFTAASVSGADTPPELAERADLVLAGPAAVVAFLRALAETIGA